MRTRADVLPFKNNIDTDTADPRVETGFGGDVLPGAVQQVHRRPERLRA